MNIQQMMKQAQQMQERLQKQMAELKVEATAGGGMVTVVVNGAKQLQSLKIDPEVVSKEDVEMLQDLIVAAINDAQRKADEEMAQTMGGMMGGDSGALLTGVPVGTECTMQNAGSEPRMPNLLAALHCCMLHSAFTYVSPRFPGFASSSSCSACPASARRGAAPGVSPAQDAARADRPPDRRAARGQGARHLLLGLQQHHRHRSLRLLQQRRPRLAT